LCRVSGRSARQPALAKLVRRRSSNVYSGSSSKPDCCFGGIRLLLTGEGQKFSGGLALFYGLVALLALGLDYTALLPLGLLQCVWLGKGRPQAWRWISLQIAVLLAALFLWVKDSQLQALGQSYQPVFIAIQANQLGFKLTPAEAGRLLGLASVGLGLVSLLVAWFWLYWLRRRLAQRSLRWFWVGGWLLLLGFAALPRGYTLKRQLIVILPYLALLSAGGLRQLPQPMSFGLIALSLAVTLLILPAHPQEPWRTVVAELGRVISSSTIIWVDDQAVPVFDYYFRPDPAETASLRWTPLVGRYLPQLPAITPEAGQFLWVVTAESRYRRVTDWLPLDFQRHYQLLETRQSPGIGLYHYRRRVKPLAEPSKVGRPVRSNQWGLLLPSPLDSCPGK
jgi:hypothetical protein